MRTSQFPLQTLKETPADAEIPSHRLMLRAGLIRKLASPVWWLPLGLRVLRRWNASYARKWTAPAPWAVHARGSAC